MAEPGNNNKIDYAFGQIAVRENLATLEQVKECLDIQQRMKGMGLQMKPLGNLLVEKGYMTPAVVDKVLRLQKQVVPPPPPPTPSATTVPLGSPGSTGVKINIPGYEMVSKIGQGAMGAVFKARQLSMDRIVAIKVLAPKYSTDSSFVRRFVNEARAVARLNHENIIAGIDVGEAGGLHYFIMEFVDGSPVVNLIQKQGKLEERRCLDIALQMGRALDHAHSHDIVHRDVKPENIMITSDGVAKLCDLGLAKQTSGDASLTMEGMSVGTPNYISPEQARGEREIDIRTDIYSLGATLYHMATGTTPFTGPNPMTVMTKHVTDDPDPPRKRNPQLTEGFNAMILKMMAKAKDRRFQTPAELIREVDRIIKGGASIPGKPPTEKHPAPVARPDLPARGHTPLPSPTKMSDSRIQDSRQNRSVPGTRSTVVPRKKSSAAAWFITILALLAAGGAGTIFVMKKIRDEEARRKQAHPDTIPQLAPTDDPRKAQDLIDQEAYATSVKQAWALYESLAPDPNSNAIVRGYARFERDVAKFKGTKFETEWPKEIQKFRDEINNRIDTQDWTERQASAKKKRDEGRFGDALEILATFPEPMRYFIRNDSQTLYTRGGSEAQELIRDIEVRLAQQFQTDLDLAIRYAIDTRFDEAFKIVARMMDYSGGPKVGDVASVRAKVMDKRIDHLLQDPITVDAVAEATRHLTELRDAHTLNGPYAEAKLKSVAALAVEAWKKTASVARFQYQNEFRPALKLMETRDFTGLRKAFFAMYFGPRWELRQAGLLLNVGDSAVFRKFLDPQGADRLPFAAVVKACEEGARTAETRPELDAARELYLDLREFALLEEFADMVIRGVPLAAPAWADYMKNARLVSAKSPRAGPRANAAAPYALEAEVNGTSVRYSVAPRLDPVVEDYDQVMLMKRSYGDDWEAAMEKDPYLRLRIGLHFYNLGASGRPFAKASFDMVPETLRFGRYTKALEGVATVAQEKEAELKYDEAMRVYGGTPENARGLLKELREKYWDTDFLKSKLPGRTKPDDPTRRQIILNLLKDLGDKSGGSPAIDKPVKPARLEDFLHAAKVKESTKNNFEVTYDFGTADCLLDFIQQDPGLGASKPRVEVKGGSLEIDDTTMLLWKPQVKGDVAATWSIKARDAKNIGFVLHATKSLSEGQGYVSWLTFKALLDGQWRDNLKFMPKHACFALPVSVDQFETQASKLLVGADVDPEWRLQANQKYTVQVTRKGKSIETLVNGKMVSRVEIDSRYNGGRLGIVLWGSQVTVESAKFTVAVDPAWIDTELKK